MAVPVFPVPALSPLAEGALEAAKLIEFHGKNRDVFAKLVCVLYADFLERTKDIRRRNPKGERLFALFCGHLEMVLTAASSQVEKRPGGENGLARALLLDHLRREGLAVWQDYFASGKHPPRVVQLMKQFVHYIAWKGFEDGAANHASNPTEVANARRVIEEINRGERELRPL